MKGKVVVVIVIWKWEGRRGVKEKETFELKWVEGFVGF